MQILLSEEEYTKMQDIIVTYNRKKSQLKISQKKYRENNREKTNQIACKSMTKRYHNDPEYREKKLQAMKIYNAKKKAEKEEKLNEEQER